MRIALIDPSLFTLPYDRALASGLTAIGHEVILVGKALRPGEPGHDEPALRQHFYPWPWLNDLPPPLRRAVKGVSHVGGMAGLPDLLRRFGADVIHFQWTPLPVVDARFLPALRRIAPTVLTVHDSNPYNGNPASRLLHLGGSAVLTGFDHLIVHTEQARARLCAGGIPAGHVTRIPHGLLHHGWDAADAVPDAPVTILQFGKIKPYKGVDVLIRAVARLSPELRGRCRVEVVGQPHMDPAPLIALARKLGVADTIRFDFRFVSDADMLTLFRRAAAVVFPYREIDASGVLAVALAAGRPIIASAVGGFAENLKAGRDAELVPPGDPAALALALARIIDDPEYRRRLALAVRTLRADVPEWPEIARRTEAVYRRLEDRREAA